MRPTNGEPLLADTGEFVTAIVTEFDPLTEPGQEIAQGKRRTYANVTIDRTEMRTPRGIKRFTDYQSTSPRTFTALVCREMADGITVQYTCEVTR